MGSPLPLQIEAGRYPFKLDTRDQENHSHRSGRPHRNLETSRFAMGAMGLPSSMADRVACANKLPVLGDCTWTDSPPLPRSRSGTKCRHIFLPAAPSGPRLALDALSLAVATMTKLLSLARLGLVPAYLGMYSTNDVWWRMPRNRGCKEAVRKFNSVSSRQVA